MSKLQLSFCFGRNPRSIPILSGQVEPDGIDLICTGFTDMSEIAWRQFGFKEFEISELSISSLVIARSHGDDNWVALPVFHLRQFPHTGVLVREDAGIDEPAQLAGKKVGVPEYQQTAALWARGILQHEFGVDPTELHWFMERLPQRSHGGVTGFRPPSGIDLTYIPEEKSIGSMLLSGELDATLVYLKDPNPNLIARSTARFGPGSGVRLLFPDQRAENTRYFSKTGIIPMNHTVVVRKDIVKRHPWVVLNLYAAFLEARKIAAEETSQGFNALVHADQLDHPRAKAFAADPYPYGIAANRDVLETLITYSYEQGLSSRMVALEELFYPATLEL